MRRIDRSGVTLSETALALFLFLAAFAACADLYGMVIDQVVMSRSRLIADRMAATFLELYESGGSGLPGLRPGDVTVENLLANSSARALLTGDVAVLDEQLRAARFALRVQVDERHGGQPGLALVRLKLSWFEDGHPRSDEHARLFSF